MQSIRCKTKCQNTRKWRNGGIINPLFDGLTYNTSGHFAHCSYFSEPKNTTQLAKYPRVLFVRSSNKVYVLIADSKRSVVFSNNQRKEIATNELYRPAC